MRADVDYEVVEERILVDQGVINAVMHVEIQELGLVVFEEAGNVADVEEAKSLVPCTQLLEPLRSN